MFPVEFLWSVVSPKDLRDTAHPPRLPEGSLKPPTLGHDEHGNLWLWLWEPLLGAFHGVVWDGSFSIPSFSGKLRWQTTLRLAFLFYFQVLFWMKRLKILVLIDMSWTFFGSSCDSLAYSMGNKHFGCNIKRHGRTGKLPLLQVWVYQDVAFGCT